VDVDDLVPILTKFHRDTLRPDIERIVAASETRLRDEMQRGFDALAQRLERMDRLDAGMDRLEARLDKVALRSELENLKVRVDGLQEQVRTLEARLAE
jgi:polyhydroxyalkanoate synthesis regulator phasin